MNALQTAQTAYAGAAPVRTARGTEYEAFARVTRDLRQAANEKSRNYPAFAEALARNRKLWTILALDVADPGNGLPAPLRAQIFYLAEFTAARTSQILSKGADVEILIELNTSVMQGLRGEPAR